MINNICQFIIGACAHRFRGQAGNLFDINDRFLAMICFGAAFFLQHQNIYMAGAVAVCYFFFIIFGWGSYFIDPADFNLVKNNFPREKEISWIDWLIELLPDYDLIKNFFGMVLRGLYLLPAFAMLGYYYNNADAILYGAVVFPFCMGFAYLIPAFVAYKTDWHFDYTGYAEGLVGGLALVLLSLSAGG